MSDTKYIEPKRSHAEWLRHLGTDSLHSFGEHTRLEFLEIAERIEELERSIEVKECQALQERYDWLLERWAAIPWERIEHWSHVQDGALPDSPLYNIGGLLRDILALREQEEGNE